MDDDCCIHGVDFTESCDLCYAEELMPADIRNAYWNAVRAALKTIEQERADEAKENL